MIGTLWKGVGVGGGFCSEGRGQATKGRVIAMGHGGKVGRRGKRIGAWCNSAVMAIVEIIGFRAQTAPTTGL